MTTATRSRASGRGVRTAKRLPKAVPLWESPLPRDPRWAYTRGDHFIEWTERHLLIPRGENRKQPLRWSPWQKDFFRRLYTCDENGALLYRTIILGIPKKNTKSTMVAAVALYDLYGDPYETNSWVACGSNSDRQADIVFGDCKEMAALSPALEEVSIRHRWQLRSKADSGFIERCAASKGKLDGKDCSKVLLDELHEMKPENWTILGGAIVGRPERGQVIGITTAGDSVKSELLLNLCKKGAAVASGADDDERFLFIWYGAEDDDDIRDERVWARTNPNYGVTVTRETMDHEFRNKTEADFRRYHVNQFVDYGELPWKTPAEIRACRVKTFELRPGLPTWTGVDLAATRDTAAVLAGQMWSEDRPCKHTGAPCLYVRARVWVPLRDRDGNSIGEISQPEVKDHIREINATHEVVTNVFDPWHSTLLRQDLEAEDITCEQIWQSGSRRAGSSAALGELIAEQRFHYCDPVVEAAIINTRTIPAGREGGYYLAKRYAKKPMDAAMAASFVVYGIQNAPAEESNEISFYEA